MKCFSRICSLAFFGYILLGLIPATIHASTEPVITPDLLLVGGGKNSAESSTDVTIQGNFLKTIQVYLLGAYAVIAI